jgi:hypothetical protein
MLFWSYVLEQCAQWRDLAMAGELVVGVLIVVAWLWIAMWCVASIVQELLA